MSNIDKINAKELLKKLPLVEKTLNNGLKFVLIQNKKRPVFTLNISYKAGSKNEKPGIRGFAHLTEHLMFEGSKNILPGDFDKYCTLAGGSNNAYTTYDWTSYHMTMPSNQLELALWLESERLFNKEVLLESLDNQKKVVIEEIKETVENLPYGSWREYLSEIAFSPESSYSWEVHGKVKDIENCTLEDINGFLDRFYHPGNACIVICGDIEIDESIKLIEKYFDKDTDLKFNNKKLEHYPTFPGKVEYEDNVNLPASFVSFHLPGFISDEIFSADILANTLGFGKSSRFYNNLVYEKEIASYAGCFLDKRELGSLITFYAVSQNAEISADKLEEEIINEIKNLIKKPINGREIEKSKNQLISQFAEGIQYTSSVADTEANSVLFFNNPIRPFKVLEKYAKLNEKDVLNIIEKYIKPEQSLIVNVKPKILKKI